MRTTPQRCDAPGRVPPGILRARRDFAVFPEIRLMSEQSQAEDSTGLCFPDHRAGVAEDARRFRSLPPRARWLEIFSLRGWGIRLADAPSRAASIKALDDDAETAWQAIQRELFARHGA